MNILFIAPYRQSDGWGRAAKDYARALETTQHNIAIRPIYMSGSIGGIDDKLLDMENRSFPSYDMVIQKVLPHLYEWYDLPCVGLFTLETDVTNTHWARYIRMMDATLVPSIHERNIVRKLGQDNVYNVSEPIDVSIFEQDVEKFPGIPTDTFNFYFIGELNERKNLTALITAFFVEFKRNELVNLVIKVNASGINTHQLRDKVQADLNTIKHKLRLYENLSLYPSIYFITDYISDVEMYQLHKACDCFVMPSYGEALCRPAVEAMGFGNTPIVTDCTGMTDFVNKQTGWVVDSDAVPVSVHSPPLPWIYTGRETWSLISIEGLQNAMRKAFELSFEDRRLKQALGKMAAKQDFSYESIGDRMDKALGRILEKELVTV